MRKERIIFIVAYVEDEDKYGLFVSKECGNDEGDMSATMSL